MSVCTDLYPDLPDPSCFPLFTCLAGLVVGKFVTLHLQGQWERENIKAARMLRHLLFWRIELKKPQVSCNWFALAGFTSLAAVNQS